VWTYLFRRVLQMIPTLFGVTVVSFCVMQLAPGDPLATELGGGGTVGASGQTREDYLIQKRDLKLDKPLLVNLRYFRDYAEQVYWAAHFNGMTAEQIAAELDRMAADPVAYAQPLAFLRSLKIGKFDGRLADPAQRPRLAQAVEAFVGIYCEDLGAHGVGPAVALLENRDAPLALRIGAIRSLAKMVVDPFLFTFSREPREEEAPRVISTWRIWWDRHQNDFASLDDATRMQLAQRVERMAALESRHELFEELETFQRGDAPFFIELLLSDAPLKQQAIAALFLRLYFGAPLAANVPLAATPEQVAAVSQNWEAHYRLMQAQYHPSLDRRLWYIVADTQYAHMVWRLVTFDFGRSTLRTREPVAARLWRAFKVSAPLMLLSQALIYLVAVPLGVLCSVYRDGWTDRSVSLGLFLLYSIPSFVAGMLFLLFFAYGGYLKWFPMERLHSDGADQMGWIEFLIDYLWHAFLPVVCLSLFSLAGLAMYSRSAMLDVIHQDYIRTARAKGLSGGKVIFKHALRNALIPIITLFASFIPALLGGSVLIEYLFNIPGMGRLSFESILNKDFPTLMALIYIDAIVVMLSILLSDVLYVVADPRISFESRGGAG
jgi:peptide/nickel transport system permease protein